MGKGNAQCRMGLADFALAAWFSIGVSGGFKRGFARVEKYV